MANVASSIIRQQQLVFFLSLYLIRYNKRNSGESLSSCWVHLVLVWVQAESEPLDQLAQSGRVVVREGLEEVDQSLLWNGEDQFCDLVLQRRF